MSHHFLPNKEQKNLKREYHIHVFIVALFFLSGVGLVGSGSLFPAYLQANLEAREQLKMMDTLKQDNDKSGIASLERELNIHHVRISALSVHDVVPASTLIQNAIALRGMTRINFVSVERPSTTTVAIKLEGQAPTRESLVLFKSRLEKLETGTTVDLPISGFAKSTDIPFSITVIQPII